MADKIYIFGAHSRGRTLAEYLRSLYPDLVIEAFLYDNEEENPSVLDGVPVLPLKKSIFFHTENPVYIGTRGIYALKKGKLKKKTPLIEIQMSEKH